MNAEPMGLRARKKRQTENAIELAGVTLARELGHAKVTVAAICDQADISRSTFFNYMPSREAAIFGKPLQLLDREEAIQILNADPGSAVTCRLFRVIIASIGHSRVNPEVAEGRMRLIEEQPETHPMVLAQFTALFTQLTELLLEWYTHHPEDRLFPDAALRTEAMTTVMLTSSAFQIVLSEVQGSNDIDLSEEMYIEALHRFSVVASRAEQN